MVNQLLRGGLRILGVADEIDGILVATDVPQLQLC
jgi:hypothetical protein